MSSQAQADLANSALDLEKIDIKNGLPKGQVNFKREEDKKYRSVAWFLDDFNIRLSASYAAGKRGLDEVKAFREGLKKEEEGGAADGHEGSVSSVNVPKQLAAAMQMTNRTRMTNRNTQRNKNKNLLEMEVEKDLTHMKNLLMKKKE